MITRPDLQIYLSLNLGEDDWLLSESEVFVNGARTTISAVLWDVAEALFERYIRAAQAASPFLKSLTE